MRLSAARTHQAASAHRGIVMVDRKACGTWALALLAGIACGAASGQQSQANSAVSGPYPQPRFPSFLVNPSDEQLLGAARAAVRQTSGRSPLGNIRSGETVHVFLTA